MSIITPKEVIGSPPRMGNHSGMRKRTGYMSAVSCQFVYPLRGLSGAQANIPGIVTLARASRSPPRSP